MRISRTVDFRSSESSAKAKKVKRKGGKISASMYSAFFSSLNDTVMCTNAMFGDLQKEIESTILPYSEKEPIALTVYEAATCSNDTKESVLIGFNKYISQRLANAKWIFKKHIITFSALCAVSAVLEFLIYAALPGILPLWIRNMCDIVCWVFVWQFAAFMAFEFAKELRAIRRFNQILNIEYSFRHWE